MTSNGHSDGLVHRRKGSFGNFNAKDVLDRATRQTYSENVFLFIPNLIGVSSRMYNVPTSLQLCTGYTRIILAAFSMHYMKNHPKLCTILYGVSCLLDAFDGMAARAFKQTSKFGAVLDMVTDRYLLSMYIPELKKTSFQQMHDLLSIVFPVICLSLLCDPISVSHHT
jgi:CDP-alcohol phosphatidyltransferase